MRHPSSAAGAGEETSSWAVGFILFAAMMMLMAGCFQFFAGLVALFNDTFYVATRNYVFQFDATTWGRASAKCGNVGFIGCDGV